MREPVPHNPSTVPLTIVIPVRNEAANLPRCLSALKTALGHLANIVVIDSGSTDETVNIAKDFGAEVLQFNWSGQYPKKRNWFLIDHTPQTPWVMFLDADEIVSDKFLSELERALLDESKSGYWINYTNYFLGKKLNYGLPQRKLALFRVGSGLYERIEENAWSSLDMEIHEHPVIEGEIGMIKAMIDHRDFRGLAKFLQRHVDYAKWETKRVQELRDGSTSQWNALTRRQQFKYKHIDDGWFAVFYFLNAYILRAGFLDGRAGFHYAFYKMWYFKSIRLMIKENRVIQSNRALASHKDKNDDT